MKNYCLPFFALFVFLCTVKAQTNYYPGGLGNANLKLWVNAANNASLTYNGSSQLSQWSDLSGNAYHFTQATTANQPIYNATAGPNSLPGIVFNRANSQHLGNTLLPSTISFSTGVSTLAIIKFTSAANFERLYDFGNGQASDNILAGRLAATGSFFYEGWNAGTGGQSYTTSTPIIDGTPNMYEAVQQGGTPGNNTAVALYSAGTAQPVTGSLGSSITPLPVSINRTVNYLGRSNWTADAYLDGAVSEVLFYNTALNTTQRSILENYLSAGWGMAISSTTYTPPVAGTFNKNLVGIGYTSGTDNVLSNPVGSTDGLGFSSGTTAGDFLNSAGFLMAAHNGQANTLLNGITLAGVTPTGINRLNRSWFLHRTSGNAAGAVTVGFSFADYNGTGLPAGAISYGLLYNATSDNYSSGTNTLLSINFTTAGSKVNFALPASSLADGYYTLVWSTTLTLPVTLIRFTAQPENNSASLGWETTREINLSHFVIERSTDALSFNQIGTVNGANTGAGTTAYHFTDPQPYKGINYYRLRIVDLDGSQRYSAVQSVRFSGRLTGISFSPNPVSSAILVQTDLLRVKANLQIINNMGQPVWTSIKTLNGSLLVPVDFLPSGVYFLQVNADKQVYRWKFVKE